MAKFFAKLLILLSFSVVTLFAQDETIDSDCNVKYTQCIETCSESDEECFNQCDQSNPCPEEDEESSEEL